MATRGLSVHLRNKRTEGRIKEKKKNRKKGIVRAIRHSYAWSQCSSPIQTDRRKEERRKRRGKEERIKNKGIVKTIRHNYAWPQCSAPRQTPRQVNRQVGRFNPYLACQLPSDEASRPSPLSLSSSSLSSPSSPPRLKKREK